MATSRDDTSKVFARDIADYNDAELDQYLEANGRFVKVEDPENLHEEFIQRLRARTGTNDASCQHPIDLNYVSARLVEEPVNKDPPLRSSSPASTIDCNDEENNQRHYQHNLQREVDYYNKLINDGGRPTHPISLGYDAAKNMEEYSEILSFWNPSVDPDDEYGWMVFSEQENRWQKFRESQRRMRTDDSLEVGSIFPALPAEQERFAAYCRRLHERLARHEFKQTFQLNEDPDRQDKSTTWIEYLGFEYVQYEEHTNVMKRLQKHYEDAWDKLVSSKVLKPSETDESFNYLELLQLKNDKNRAQEAVDSVAVVVQAAEKVLLKAQASDLSGWGLAQMEQNLSVARFKLLSGEKLLEKTSTRYELVRNWMSQTKTYRIAKDQAASRSKLLRWILQQLPMIEREMKPVHTKNNSTEGNGRRQRSLKRNRLDDCNEEPVSKRHRQAGDAPRPSIKCTTRASTVRKTSSNQQARQTRSSYVNSSTLFLKPNAQQAFDAPRQSNTSSASKKFGMVLSDSARVCERKQRHEVTLDGTPDSRVLRRSSRTSRPPERFQ